MRKANRGDRGSASIWIIVGAVVVLVAAYVAMFRTTAVLARHKAESAADLAALAAAGGIGVDADSAAMCARAAAIAAANGASITSCLPRLGADGRSGTVDVTVTVAFQMIAIGAERATGTARAGREPP